jgi:signal recognition particle receptor subunit beta
MPVVNPLARELVFKIVYYGPGLGGKTTTLQHIHATTRAEHRGKMVSLATPVDRTLYFDFLPIRIPTVRGMGVRLQLFTVPGQVYYNATRKLVLTGADGVVLVVDSQRLRADASLESLENLRDNLREHGRSLSEVPHVIQYNKRDLSDVLPIEDLERRLNREGAPSFATIATQGDGVYESLEAIARAVLDDFEKRMPETRGLSAGRQLELPEGGLAEALRRAEGEPVPVSAPLSNLGSGISAPPGAAVRHSSGLLRLSGLPEADPGEDAARAIAELPGPSILPAEPRDSMIDLDAPASDKPDDGPLLAVVSGSTPLNGGGTPTHRAREPEILATAPPAPTLAAPVTSPAETEQAPATWSFDILWPSNERALVRDLETALASRQYARALALSDQLVARALASAASVLGSTPDAPRDPAVVALLLGAEGRRYLEFRALVRDARNGREVAEFEALAAYAFAVEMRLARNRVRT